MKIIIKNVSNNKKIIFLNNFVDSYSVVFLGLFLLILFVSFCLGAFVQDKWLFDILRVFFNIWFYWALLTTFIDLFINMYLSDTEQKIFELTCEVDWEDFLKSIKNIKDDTLELENEI